MLIVISKENKFIFIHIPKTGGTSVEHFLLNRESVSHPLSPREKIEFSTGTQLMQHKKLNQFSIRHQKEYFCFCFVRNPWDKVVSDYIWIKKHKRFGGLNFLDFVNDPVGYSCFAGHGDEQVSFINENINYIGRFENLQKDFDIICEKAKIDKGILPVLNQSARSKNYRSMYNNQARYKIEEKFWKDIDRFNYSF